MNKTLIALALTLTIGACQTPQQNAALECGAAGAGIGFLTCKLLGGSDAKCAGWGAAGGTLGAAGCYAYSNHLEQQRQQLKGHENELDARLTYLRNVNQTTAEYNANMQTQIAEITAHNDATLQLIRTNKVDQSQLKKQQELMDKMLDDANKSLASQRESVAYMQQLQATNNMHDPKLAQELKIQLANLEKTKQQTAALAAQRQRI